MQELTFGRVEEHSIVVTRVVVSSQPFTTTQTFVSHFLVIGKQPTGRLKVILKVIYHD